MIKLYTDEDIERICKPTINYKWQNVEISPYTQFREFKKMQFAWQDINSHDGRLNPKKYNKYDLLIGCLNCKLMYEYMLDNSSNYKEAFEKVPWINTPLNKLLVALSNHVDYNTLDTNIQRELKRNNLESKLGGI